MSVIRFPPYRDLRQQPPLTRWERFCKAIVEWLNPPQKAEVFEIKNPRFYLARMKKQRGELS